MSTPSISKGVTHRRSTRERKVVVRPPPARRVTEIGAPSMNERNTMGRPPRPATVSSSAGEITETGKPDRAAAAADTSETELPLSINKRSWLTKTDMCVVANFAATIKSPDCKTSKGTYRSAWSRYGSKCSSGTPAPGIKRDWHALALAPATVTGAVDADVALADAETPCPADEVCGDAPRPTAVLDSAAFAPAAPVGDKDTNESAAFSAVREVPACDCRG